MSGHIKMKDMTWTEYAGRKEDILILPIGATEQHGPHLPLCVDTVLAEEFSYRIAGQVDGIVAGPLLWIQIKTLQRGRPAVSWDN